MELTSPTPAAAATRGPIVRGAAALATLPAIEPRTARLARLVADERLAAWLQLTLGINALSVEAGEHTRFADPGWIDLSHGFAHASVAIDLAQYPALASVAVDTASRDAMPTGVAQNAVEPMRDGDAALRNAVAAILLAPLIEQCAMLGLADVRVLGVRRARVPADPRATFAVAFRHGQRRIECLLGRLDDGCVETLSACVARQQIPYASHVSAISVPGRLLAGARTYRIDALRSLRPGDVLLRAVDAGLAACMDASRQSVDLRAIWGIPGAFQLAADVRIEGCTMTFQGTPTMTYETEDHEAPLHSEEPLNIGELNLPVKFELDTVPMPVVQLSALRAGYVVELPVPVADARIRLTSYGQTIGLGELVTVGEQLGVRIVQMSHGNVSVQ